MTSCVENSFSCLVIMFSSLWMVSPLSFSVLWSSQQSAHHVSQQNKGKTICNEESRIIRQLAANKFIIIHSMHHLIIINIIIIIIIKSFYFLWSIGHLWRASRHCSLQLSPWPHCMIFLCVLSHPLLSFTTFSLAYLSYVLEDSNLMQFFLLLLFLYVMCVQSNSIFFFLSDFLLTSDEWFSTVLRS